MTWVSGHDDDNLLERGELALITIVLDVGSSHTTLIAGQESSLQIISPQGSVLPITREAPPSRDGAMSL